MDLMHCLVDKGNSILVIEHNLDVIRCADWIIDLGPDGDDKGGEIVVVGIQGTTASEIARRRCLALGRRLGKVVQIYCPSESASWRDP